MKTESTFTDAGWDFVEIWDIGEIRRIHFCGFVMQAISITMIL